MTDRLLFCPSSPRRRADIRKEQEERDKVRGQGTDGGGQAQELQKQLDYYPSGLTPPTTNIVRRRFAETRMHGPYPVSWGWFD